MNKQLSILMVMMMIAAPLAAMPFAVGGPSMPIETPMFTGGDGTILNPYHIVNVSDLQNMSVYLDAHYILTKNIDASNTSVLGHWANNVGEGFDPIGDNTNKFTGSLDGQNYSISGLYINRAENNIGLIGRTDTDTVIKNVNLVDVDITGNQYVGGLVGSLNAVWGENTYLQNCSVHGQISGHSRIGGIAGYIYCGNIQNSFFRGTVSGSAYTVGGVMGLADTSTISNCYSQADVSGSDDVGGFIGQRNGAVISDCYSTGHVSGGGDRGGFIGLSLGGSSTNCFWDIETSGWATSAGGETGKSTAEMHQQATFTGWDFNVVGDGTIGNWIMAGYPHLQYETTQEITDVVDLQLMAIDLGISYTVMNNIDTSATSGWNGGQGFVPIGTLTDPFLGTLFGHGHIISNLFIDIPSTSNVGLFGHLQSGTVNGVSLVDFNITGYSQTAGLVGRNSAGGTINNCSVNGNLTGVFNSNNVGGIVGLNYGLVSNCYATGSISGHFSVGGIVGQQPSGTIDNCYSVCSVTATSHVVGGILGICGNSGTVENSYSSGKVTSTGAKGGLIGNVNSGTVNNCFWDNETAASVLDDTGDAGNVTGITGLNTIDMLNNFTFTNAGWDFTNTWFSVNESTRPFLRMEWDTNISNSHQVQLMIMNLTENYTLTNDIDMDITNPASMWGTSIADGDGFLPIGNDTSRFNGSLNGQNSTITGLYISNMTMQHVGLFGVANTISEIVYVNLLDANVSGGDRVGALVGNNMGEVNNCSANGTVSGGITYGLLVGYNNGGYVNYSHSTGSVTGGGNAGGLIGYNTGEINNCSSTGTVDGTGDNVGGFAGYNNGIIRDSYSTSDVNGIDTVAGFVGSTDRDSVIDRCYASGNVDGAVRVGGFIGENYDVWNPDEIHDCYATGDVHGTGDIIGGFIGEAYGNIDNCYSTGKVSPGVSYGGFIGNWWAGTVTNCFWDNETSGMTASDDGTGLNTADMLNDFTFTNAGWDFDNVWFSVNGSTRPFLRMEHDTTIRNSHQLQLMQMNLTADYTLANDIDLSDITNNASMWGTSVVDGEGFYPVGNNTDLFTGSFNGNGLTINDLYINKSTMYAGLFGFIGSSVLVSNTTLANVNITGTTDVGSFAAENFGTIQNCHVTGNISGTGSHIGGLAGYNAFEIIDCIVSANVDGQGDVGGLVGRNEGTSVADCSSFGTVTGSGNSFGGLIGFGSGPLSDSTSFSKVSNIGWGHSYTGGLIGRQDGSTISSCEAYGNVTGSTWHTGGLLGYTMWCTITNCSAYGITKGLGNSIGGLVGRSGGTIINSHTYSDTGNNKAWTGGLVGSNVNSGVIQDSSVHGDVFGNGITGGIAGENKGSISNCSYNGAVTGTAVSGVVDTGGIVGRNSGGTISNCTSSGTVTGNRNNVGGLVGYSTGPVSNSTSFSDVFNIAPAGNNHYGTGGLIGKQEGSTVSSSEAYGNVSGCKFFTGGLIGHIAPGSTVMDSSSHGVTTGAGNTIGGLAGRNEGTISNCSAYGNTGDTKSWTGGLVGENLNLGLIQNSSAHGDVFGNSITGGLVGENEGTIERSYSTGDVMATSDRVGGFVGWNNGNFVGEITDCYSHGNITGGDDDGIGGFVGNHSYDASITNVYSTGLVTGVINVGGLVGTNWISTVTDSHWDTETSGQATSVNGTGHDTNEMMSQSTFTNWDFTNVWGIVEANTYPFLRALETGFTASADLEITMTDLQDPASTNGTLTYMLTLTNHGPDNAANVYVNVTLPLGVTYLDSNPPLNVNGRYLDADIGTLLNGESGGAFVNVSVDSFGTGELNCTAFVTSSTLDPGAFDNETYELTQLHLAPVAVNDAETLDEDSGANTIYVLKNDTDAENDALTITDVTQPNNGTVIITEAGKNLTFEPDADWNGINTFTYTIMDDAGGIDKATVTITVLAVDDASIAVNDTYNVTEDSGATTLDVLANDYDVDGDVITISTAIQPAHGTISIATNGFSIDYTPDADYTGTDSFTYNVSSGIEPATVTIDVTPVNDVPVITTTDIITATEDVLYSVDYNATDADGDTLSWNLNTDAGWLSMDTSTGVLSGTPTSDDVGNFWVNVSVTDGIAGAGTNFTLTVNSINHAPVISTTTAPDGTQDQPYSLQVNASDANGDSLTWSLASNATWLSINATGVLSGTPISAGIFYANIVVDDGNGGTDSANLTIIIASNTTTPTDTDGDGTPDDQDDFPDDPDEDTDTDGDGTGDNADAFPTDPAETTDTDGDGVGDNADAFPSDPTEDTDTDGDGIGNNADTDDDGDGIPDTEDDNPLTPDDTDADTGGSNTWLYLILILVIVGAIAGFLVMRGKGAKPAEEPEAIEEAESVEGSDGTAPEADIEDLNLE